MNESIQAVFFQQLKDRTPLNISLVDQVSDLLNISSDSAYRRIRGETALTLEEADKLCRHYRLSLDSLSNTGPDAVTFIYKSVDNAQQSGFHNFMAGMLSELEAIVKFEKRELIYAAKDIPLFHYFQYPELAAFKIFFWLKSILVFPGYDEKTFKCSDISHSFTETGRKIWELYVKIPSVEIWTEETLNSTLKQLEYSYESGFFEKREDALLVCDQILIMMEHIKKQAEHGFKYNNDNEPSGPEGNFSFYYSEVMIGNNNILANTGDFQTTFLTHNTLNYLVTRNAGFCRETELWLKNLTKKSTLISTVSEKQRNQFFRKSSSSILELREMILNKEPESGL